MAAAGAIAETTDVRKVSFKETSSTLGASRSAPLLRSAAVPSSSSTAVVPPTGYVSLQSLQNFLFPPALENPDVAGRFELFAVYGPIDEQGFLRGGVGGTHVHTDLELKQMAESNCREALFSQFKKPRSSVESVVESLLPVAMAQKYTWADVERILGSVDKTRGCVKFDEAQDAIIANQQKRLGAVFKRAKEGKPIAPPAERAPRVPYQSKSAAQLMEVTHKAKYSGLAEKELADSRRLHSYAGSIATMEDQHQTRQLRANVLLVRDPGDVGDRWDRYCAMRRTGRSSYVKARNQLRLNPSMDEGISNKHPMCSSLLAASASGSSAAAALGAM